MKRPKILQVNKLYYPWIGGVEQVVQDIAEGLKDETDMEVLACRSRGLGKKETVNGVPVRKAASLGVFWGMPMSFSFPFQLAREGRDRDVLHFHLPFPLGVVGFLPSFLTDKKVVVTYHSDIVRQEKLMGAYRPLLEKFLKRADLILPTSPALAEKSPYLKPFSDKCRPVPLSIPLEEYGPENPGKAPVEAEGEKVVLFVGRLSYYKGVEVLLQAMEEVEARLLVVGEGPLRENLEQKSQSLEVDDKVNFLGEVSEEELKGLYGLAEVFVLPSVARSEAFGLVQLEAMAYGVPVVNTSLPTGVPYVSKHEETGLTVEPGNPRALAGAINKILGDQKLAEKLGGNGRKRVQEKFSRQDMLEAILEIYRSHL